MPLLAKVPPSHKDYQMSREIVKLWVQFAKAEVDVEEGSIKSRMELEFLGTKWPPQDPTQPLQYFQLDATPKLIQQPYTDRIQFWNSLDLAKTMSFNE